eukprot:1150275-Pelagomonas_calceolata.AAC.3
MSPPRVTGTTPSSLKSEIHLHFSSSPGEISTPAQAYGDAHLTNRHPMQAYTRTFPLHQDKTVGYPRKARALWAVAGCTQHDACTRLMAQAICQGLCQLLNRWGLVHPGALAGIQLGPYFIDDAFQTSLWCLHARAEALI